MNGEDWCALHFDSAYVSAQNIILGPGGFRKQIAGFNAERIGNASRSLALGEYSFGKAREYAAERVQFGRPICEFQGIQWKFSEMKIKIDAARLLLYRAAVNADRGFPSALERRSRKRFATRPVRGLRRGHAGDGGTGYSTETLVEYCFRKCRGWQIAGGSTEMMRNRIAEHVFDRRFPQRPPQPNA